MRKTSTLIGLTLVALGTAARAEDRAPVAPAPAAAVVDPSPPAPPPSELPRFRIRFSFLPMGLGTYTTSIGGLSTPGDATFAYGFGLAADYRIIAGFSAGLAPQIIYNVKYKVDPNPLGASPATSQTDFMLRLAYTFPVVETIGLYLEALPGYSSLSQPGQSPATGFVFGVGGGAEMDLVNRIFATVGAGYQWGFQSITIAGDKFDTRTRYVRVSLGGGVKF
jgi:Outer membrane protein beta-barrel domain